MADDPFAARLAELTADPFAARLTELRGPDPLANVKKRLGQEIAPVSAPPEQSFLSRQWDRLKDSGRAMFDAAQSDATQEFIEHPIDFLTDDPKRRQLERGVADALPFMSTAARGLIGDTEASDTRYAPEERGTGNLLGTALPNPAIKAGFGAAGRILGKPASSVLGGALRGATKGVLGYELGTVPVATAEAALRGDSPNEVAKNVATDPLGLMMSVAGGSFGGAAQGKAAEIRNPKTLSGRTIRTIEASGGKVRKFGQPTGGLYDAPELTSLKEGRAGTNELGDQSQGRIVEHNRAKLGELRNQFGEKLEPIIAEHAQEPYDFSEMHGKLDDIEKSITASNGKIADPELKAALDHLRGLTSVEVPAEHFDPTKPINHEGTTTAQAIAMLEKAQAHNPSPEILSEIERLQQGATQSAGHATTAEGTVEDLLKAQKVVKAKAQWGSISTNENRPYRILDGILSEEGTKIDPRLGTLKAEYAQGIESLKKANSILFNSAEPDIKHTPAQQRAAALRLGRIGDETQAATGASERQLEELRKLDPAYARELDLLAAKKAGERIRYGAPEVSTSIEKGMGHASSHGAAKAIATGLGLHLGGPVGAVAGLATSSLLQNPLALKLRLGLPAAEAIGRNITGSSGTMVPRLTNPIMRANEEKKKRDAKNSRILSGEQ